MAPNRILGLVSVVCLLVVLACGKSSSPTGPTGSTSTGIVNTYVGTVDLGGGVTGTLQLRASSSLASLKPDGVAMWSRLLEWVEPTVAAQGSTASGLLFTSNGDVIPLTGTFSNGSFNVSGSGFTIVAAVANTSISGTVTGPGVSAPVLPPPAPPVTTPPPANPVGTYTGTFHIETTMTFVNRRVSDNSLELNCTFAVTTNGSLSLRLFNVLANGNTQSELTVSYSEGRIPTSCKNGDVKLSTVPPSVSSESVNPTWAPIGFEGPASSLFYGHSTRLPNGAGQGLITEAETFSGAVSGSTVVMNVTRSHQFVNQLATNTSGLVNSVYVFPPVTVTTTLTK